MLISARLLEREKYLSKKVNKNGQNVSIITINLSNKGKMFLSDIVGNPYKKLLLQPPPELFTLLKKKQKEL